MRSSWGLKGGEGRRGENAKKWVCMIKKKKVKVRARCVLIGREKVTNGDFFQTLVLVIK